MFAYWGKQEQGSKVNKACGGNYEDLRELNHVNSY
jgi:hypothetical protein